MVRGGVVRGILGDGIVGGGIGGGIGGATCGGAIGWVRQRFSTYFTSRHEGTVLVGGVE